MKVTSLVLLLPAVSLAAVPLPEKVSFNQHIRPLLSDKCFSCHGFDAKHRKAGLRLDTPEGATADNEGVRAIVPGKLSESEAWKRILSKDEDEVMPPPDSHKTLSEPERALIQRWIEQGAAYQKHWSFETPVKHSVPAGAAHPVDAFLLQKLAGEKLAMNPEADRETLIRRVAFSLTGLPPVPQEVDAFLADKEPGAYERMVDRFLASLHFGEEMARHWLDIARYGDTHGLHLDNERQTWAYRDWVVKAFNTNLPFDRFSIEQLAGDLLPNPTQDQLVATGFNRCNVTTSEGGSINEEWIYRYAVDRASTTAQAWMGLTAGCATCHDHKFDPISTKEFYSMYAFFHSAADPAMDGNTILTNPVLKLSREEDKKVLADWDAKIAAKQQELEKTAATLAYTDPAKAEPKPVAKETEMVWVDDEWPTGAQLRASGHPLKWRTTEQGAKVFSGTRAIKRNQAGLTQDFFDQGAALIVVPEKAEIFVHVYLEPADAPGFVMVQFYKNGSWDHRAMWGDEKLTEWGKKNTHERHVAGPLPEKGKWVRLAVSAEKVGLKAGDQLSGLAITQHGGTVFWDKFGVKGLNDPANDPSLSFVAWWKSKTGADVKDLPEPLRKLAKQGPEKAHKPEEEKPLRDYYLANVCSTTKPQLNAFSKELDDLRAKRKAADDAIPSTFVFKDLEKPRDSFVMLRGQYDKPGEKVLPSTPAILPPLKKAAERATRLDLAKWLFTPEHPLTSRVAANRLWQQFFGTGLVKSSGDFGSQGEPPSHPELLDFLAVHFRETGWDTKKFVRFLLTSAAFRQGSAATPELVKRDPENRLYARGPRIRLQAEQIRDNALFVSGLIALDFGGKGVKPYQPANIWEPVGFSGSNTRNYKQDSGSALYRRSIYTFLKRTAPPPFMSNFDGPNREQICVIRERSNTPMQALQLMNDVQQVEAARALAQRIIKEGGADPAARITFGFRTVLARQPVAGETAILRQQLDAHLARYNQDAEAAKKLISAGESKPDAQIPPADLAAYTMIASTLLNLDETISRN